jgi:hypothetical protein
VEDGCSFTDSGEDIKSQEESTSSDNIGLNRGGDNVK